MLLKNWYRALSATLGQRNDIYTVVNISGASKTMLYLGTENISFGRMPTNYAVSMRELLTTMSNYHGGVILGTGTTEVTMDDYTLSGDMITTFTFSADCQCKETDAGSEITSLFTITNTGSESFTIGEIGLVGFYSSNTGANDKILLERTVLETPITIEPGGVGQVTYTIRMNYPTA